MIFGGIKQMFWTWGCLNCLSQRFYLNWSLTLKTKFCLHYFLFSSIFCQAELSPSPAPLFCLLSPTPPPPCVSRVWLSQASSSSPSLFLMFSTSAKTFSHKMAAWSKNLILILLLGAPNNLGVDCRPQSITRRPKIWVYKNDKIQNILASERKKMWVRTFWSEKKFLFLSLGLKLNTKSTFNTHHPPTTTTHLFLYEGQILGV